MLTIHNDEGRLVKTAFFVNQDRVQHYDAVIESMTASAIDRFVTKYRKYPAQSAINSYKAQLTRMMTIQRNITGAQSIEIAETMLLNESV
jgi:hypothetical protein